MVDAQFTIPKIKDALRGEFVDEIIPTVTIKKAQLESTMDTNTLRSSYTPSGTANALLTYLHLESNVEKTYYSLADRNGTLDIFALGTAVVVGNKLAVTLQGDIKKPIHTVVGSLNVYNEGAGSYAAGSFIIAWELIQI